jgi:hypothetical protein
MKTITHIDTQRTEGIVNPLLVQESFSFSEIEYKQFIYELGLRFLKEFYGQDDLAIQMVERSIYFWKWWKNEYLQLEKKLYDTFYEAKIDPEKENFKGAMTQLIIHQFTFESYLTFLKIHKDKIRCQGI